MTRSLVGEVKTLFDVYKSEQEQKQDDFRLYNKNFDFLLSFKENEILPKKNKKDGIAQWIEV